MKNRLLISLMAIVLGVCALSFSACVKTNPCYVLFMNDGAVYATLETPGGKQITLPKEPTKTDHLFAGWYLDENVWQQEFNSDSLLKIVLQEDVAVYARFVPVVVGDHTHSFTDSVTQPTCMDKGYTTHACECGFSYVTSLVDALNHNVVATPEVLPSCTEGGLTGGTKCDRCQQELTPQTYVDPLGHEFGEYVFNNDATTKADGTKTACCSRECGATHTITALGTKLPNNLTLIFLNGATQIQKIETTVGGEIVLPEPDEIDCVFNGWYLDEGNWQVPFTTDYINNAELDGEIKIYAYFTLYHTHSYTAGNPVLATCETVGYTVYSCYCGYSYKSDFVDALGHTEAIISAKEPTCTTDGNMEGTKCSTCEKILIVPITLPARHTLSVIPSIPATCTTEGKTESQVCTVCSQTVVPAVTIEALGHNLVASVTAPTCVDEGHTVKACGCGYYEITFENALGHEYGEYTLNNDGSKSATCTRDNCGYLNTIPFAGNRVPASLTVIFLHGTTEIERQQTIVGGNLTIPTPTQDGMVFDGWYLDEGKWQLSFVASYINNEELSGDILVYAKFSLSHTHSYVVTETVEATCETIGYSSFACPCGHSYVGSYVDALGHAEVVSPAVKVTCTTDGKSEGIVCSRCEKVIKLQVTISKTGHAIQITPAKAPTCTTNGNTEGEHCSTCNLVFTESQVVLATGHTLSSNVVAPTCIDDGHTFKLCACGYSESTIQSALGHDFAQYVYDDNATIKADGTKTASCSRGCGATHTVNADNTQLKVTVIFLNAQTEIKRQQLLITETLVFPTVSVDNQEFDGWYLDEGKWQIPFTVNYLKLDDISSEIKVYAKFTLTHAHSYASAVTAPTCETVGFTTYACACGYSYDGDFVDALGHTEVVAEAKAPTCTTEGNTEGVTCSVCDKVLKAQISISATGHTIQITYKIPATCTTNGTTEGQVCSTCDEVLVESQVILATGHTFKQQTTSPTCTDNGYTIKACACGHYETVSIDALGHIFGEYVSNGDATTEADGTKTASCTRGCGATDTVVDEGSQIIVEHVHDYILSVYPATCTEQGYTVHVCSCGETFTDSYTNAIGHEFKSEDYLDNGDGTLTAECSRRGCRETNTINDTSTVILSDLAYLEDFGSEQVVDAVRHDETTTDSAGYTQFLYSPKFTTITNKIYFSHLSIPVGSYTASLNGTSVGAVTVDANGEMVISSLPSGLTLGNKYSLTCTTEKGKSYIQTIRYVSRTIDDGNEFLRAVTYYNQHAKVCSKQTAIHTECGDSVSMNLSSPNSSYVNSAQYYNGSSFSQRYYVLCADIMVDHDLVHYGVGGGGFISGITDTLKNPYCDLYHQRFSTWFDVMNGQGYSVTVENFVDGSLFGHIQKNAKVCDLNFTPISTWWNQTAVATKSGLAMSISSGAVIDNVAMSFNFDRTVAGLSVVALNIDSGARLSNMYIYLPQGFGVDPTVDLYATVADNIKNTGYIGGYADVSSCSTAADVDGMTQEQISALLANELLNNIVVVSANLNYAAGGKSTFTTSVTQLTGSQYKLVGSVAKEVSTSSWNDKYEGVAGYTLVREEGTIVKTRYYSCTEYTYLDTSKTYVGFNQTDGYSDSYRLAGIWYYQSATDCVADGYTRVGNWIIQSTGSVKYAPLTKS